MSGTLKFKKFDMSSIEDDATIVILGKRRSGKSFLVRDIMYHKRRIPIGTIFAPTEDVDPFFSDFVPHIFIKNEYDIEILHKFLNRQRKAKQKADVDPNVDPRAFLILDDCLYDTSWQNDKPIRYVFLNGRHLKVLTIITMQHPLGIPPNLRTNVDYVFILLDNILSNRKRIHDHWAGMFNKFKTFCKAMDSCTENYECMVINNVSRSNKLSDIVYWYKAQDHYNFKIGLPMFWEMARRTPRNYEKDDEYRERDRHPVHIKKLKHRE